MYHRLALLQCSQETLKIPTTCLLGLYPWSLHTYCVLIKQGRVVFLDTRPILTRACPYLCYHMLSVSR
jgi:hypothetical protein